MTPDLTLHDWLALSPLLILFFSTMLVLTLESISERTGKKYAFFTTLGALCLVGTICLNSPTSDNPLLTKWLSFDPLAHFFNLFFILIGIGVILISPFYHGEYYFLVLSSISGLFLIGSAADFLTLFLGIETLSIPLYILCGYNKNQTLSHESAIKYFLTGALATAFLVYGIALLYGATGSTDFGTLLGDYQGISSSQDMFLFLAGIAFITVALGFKAAIVPFHQWAPDVYSAAPTSVTAFMAVGTKIGAFAAFTRIFFITLPSFNLQWNECIGWLAAITLIYANFVALKQRHLRRFFAYSGIAQAGFLLIPFASGSALTPLLFYLVIYALATLGCFSVIKALENSPEGISLDDLQGLFKQSPLLALFFSFCLLTLAGIPPTAGFLGKFFILKEAFQKGYVTLGLIGILTSIFAIYYYLRPIALMLMDKKREVPHKYFGLTALLSFCLIFAISLFPAPLWNYLSEL